MTASEPYAWAGARLTLLVEDGIVTVAIVGAVGTDRAARLRDLLIEACEVCIGVLAVDLSRCTHLSDAAVGVLLEITRRSPKGRYRLHITATDFSVIEALAAAAIPAARGLAVRRSSRLKSPFS